MKPPHKRADVRRTTASTRTREQVFPLTGGEGLWLCVDGRLLELDFAGTYDTTCVKDMEWKTTATFLTPAEAIESGWSAEAIFAAVRSALLTMKRGRAIERQQQQTRRR